MTMEMVIFLDDDKNYEKNCEDVNSTFPAQLPPSQSTFKHNWPPSTIIVIMILFVTSNNCREQPNCNVLNLDKVWKFVLALPILANLKRIS